MPNRARLVIAVSGFALMLCLLLKFAPYAFSVSSRGTNFETLSGTELRIVGLSILAMGIVVIGLAIPISNQHLDPSEPLNSVKSRRFLFAESILTCIPTAFVALLALNVNRPPNTANSNSRIHWVDYRVGNRTDEWVYIVTRILFRIFESHPALLAMALAIVSSFSLYLIARAIGFSSRLASLAPLVLLVPGYSVAFLDLGEDVSINTTATLVALGLIVKIRSSRAPRLVCAVASILVFSSRPTLLPSVLAFTILYLWLTQTDSFTQNSWLKKIAYLLRRSAWLLWPTILLISLHQIFFSLVGQSFLTLSSKTRFEGQLVEGFLISPFSGAFLGHALWIFAPLLVAIGFLIVVASPRRSSICLALLLSSGVGFVVALLPYEFVQLPYYNVRYVHTGTPFIWVAVLGVVGLFSDRLGAYFRPSFDPKVRVSTSPGVLRGILLVALVSTLFLSSGASLSISGLLHQRRNEFDEVRVLRGTSVIAEVTVINGSTGDLNQIARALMVDRSTLASSEVPACNKSDFYIGRLQEIAKLPANTTSTLYLTFEGGIALFGCDKSAGSPGD